MSKRFGNLLLLTAAALLFVVFSHAANSEEKKKELEHDAFKKGQQTGVWCWAAVAEMTMAYHGYYISQCEQVNHYLCNKGKDCCTLPPCGGGEPASGSSCLTTGWPQYDKYCFESKTTKDGVALTWDQLKDQIDADLPVNFSWQYGKDEGGHIMLAAGWRETKDENNKVEKWVIVYDPEPFCEVKKMAISYSEYEDSPSSYWSHWRDYYDIRRKNEPCEKITADESCSP